MQFVVSGRESDFFYVYYTNHIGLHHASESRIISDKIKIHIQVFKT